MDDLGARRDLYALAARVFAGEVDLEFLRRLRSDEVRRTGLELLDADLRKGDEPAALTELASEYCRLFLGPLPVCAPYASVCRGEALLGGRARARLKQFLERHGLEVDAQTARVASSDHLAVQLALLARIYGGGLDGGAAEVDLPAARELVTEHLLPWAPGCLETLANAARREPYRTVARLTAELLDDERRLHQL